MTPPRHEAQGDETESLPDPARLAALVSPLRRALLALAREREALPDIPDAQIEIIRLLPLGTASTPGELATALGASRSTVSNLLAALEGSGLIIRRRHAIDGRRVEVVASPKALELFARFDAATVAITSEATAMLEAHDQRTLHAALPALEKLTALLAAARSSPQSLSRKRALAGPRRTDAASPTAGDDASPEDRGKDHA